MIVHKKFHIQRRSNDGYTWYEPRDHVVDDKVMHADTITELRESLLQIADERTFTWAVYYRIVTNDGAVVEKYKMKPGVLTKTRSKS